MNIRNGILIILCIFIAACSSTSVKSRIRSLDEAITDYNVGLRWAMFNRIEDYHRDKDGGKQELDRSVMENIRVTGYNIQQQIVNEDVTEAVVKGEVDYYATDSGTLKKVSFTHNWWYDEELKRWFVESDFLNFRQDTSFR